MNTGSADSLIVQAIAAAGQLNAAQPTAAQVERFQTQLQAQTGAGDGVAYYGAPAIASAVPPNEVRPVVEYMEKMGADFRRHFEASSEELRLQPDPMQIDMADESPTGQLMRQLQMTQQQSQELYRRMLDASLVDLQFTYIAKQCEMAVRNVQTLYQQSG